jgi:16S rRNA (guanine966-N2)-methyltransferase
LYAGSGAVGLEAASRGAARVVLVERDPHALAALRANVQTLALPQVQVQGESVRRYLAESPEQSFDIVFLDPPYADPVADVLEALFAGGWLAPDAVVVFERATRDGAPDWPPGGVTDRSRRYGDSTLWYGRRP